MHTWEMTLLKATYLEVPSDTAQADVERLTAHTAGAQWQGNTRVQSALSSGLALNFKAQGQACVCSKEGGGDCLGEMFTQGWEQERHLPSCYWVALGRGCCGPLGLQRPTGTGTGILVAGPAELRTRCGGKTGWALVRRTMLA